MDTDVNSVDEIEDDEYDKYDEYEETLEPVTVQDGKPVTIVAQELSKHFIYKGGTIKAVDGVSFTFTEQQFVTIVGPSGSGKSTLLYILGGMDQATGGELVVDGVNVHQLSEQRAHQFRRKNLGFVFQSFHLLSHLTALENVMLPMQLAGGQSQAQISARAREILVEVGISEDRHNHKPGKLSEIGRAHV